MYFNGGHELLQLMDHIKVVAGIITHIIAAVITKFAQISINTERKKNQRIKITEANEKAKY